MTAISRALNRATEQLSKTSDTPRLDAEILMAEALGMARDRLILSNPNQQAPDAFFEFIERRAKGEPVATMPCPRCEGMLHEETFDEVSIDRCDRCNGVWLDAGELEQIIKEENPSGRWLSIFWPASIGKRADEE